jgi:hypothetical protein
MQGAELGHLEALLGAVVIGLKAAVTAPELEFGVVMGAYPVEVEPQLFVVEQRGVGK